MSGCCFFLAVELQKNVLAMCGKHQIWFSVSPNQSTDFFRDISLQWLTIIDGEKQKRQSTTRLKGDFADFQAVCIITVGVEYANVTLSIFPAPRAPLSFAHKKKPSMDTKSIELIARARAAPLSPNSAQTVMKQR